MVWYPSTTTLIIMIKVLVFYFENNKFILQHDFKRVLVWSEKIFK